MVVRARTTVRLASRAVRVWEVRVVSMVASGVVWVMCCCCLWVRAASGAASDTLLEEVFLVDHRTRFVRVTRAQHAPDRLSAKLDFEMMQPGIQLGVAAFGMGTR